MCSSNKQNCTHVMKNEERYNRTYIGIRLICASCKKTFRNL